MIHLFVLLGCALTASIIHLVTPSTALGNAIVAASYVILFFTAFSSMFNFPDRVYRLCRQRNRQKKIDDVLSYHWNALCEPHHIKTAYKTAAEDGCLSEFQCRMAKYQNGEVLIGQLYSALELSRVDAGLKVSVNTILFEKHNSFSA